MPFRRAAAALTVCCLWVWSAPAAERYMSVSEITPGMIGVGRTAFTRAGLEDFKVHILGILPNTSAPGRDLILARLEGGPLARTGVIAGMSGSPVYINGRMIGAVAYSLGNFPTEPIAGITPIAEMLDASRMASGRQPAAPLALPSHITRESFTRVIETIARTRSVWTPSSDRLAFPVSGPLDPALLAGLRPIATPVSFGGLPMDALAPLSSLLARAGFVAVPSGSTGQQSSDTTTALRPGDPVGAMLARGDYDIGATGTVTEVDGPRVYAFGHPLFGLGPTRVPMTTATVQAILPSLMSSTRITTTGPVIGTFTQDRATVLAGAMGPAPDMIPLTVGLTGPDGRRRTIRLSMIDDEFFTPLLAYVAVGGVLSTFERDLGVNTYAVRGSLSVRGHAPVEFTDVFAGEASASEAAATLSVPLAALESNTRESARIDGVTLEVTTVEHDRSLAIERVWIDAPEVRPGRAFPIRILVRPYRGSEDVRTVSATIPAWVQGPLTLVVADGRQTAQFEAREGHTSPPPSSVAQLLSRFREVKRNNRIYVRLYARDAGAMVAGEALTSLPNSVLAVVEGDRASGGTSALGSALVAAWDIPVESAVTGMRTLTINPVAARQP